MYNKLTDETNDFINKIKKSEAYLDYIKYKSIIDNSTELRRKVDEFRRKSFEIQMGHNYGFYNSYEKLVSLKSENEELLNNPDVKNFLDAELKIAKVISSIYDSISDSLNFDMNFLT